MQGQDSELDLLGTVSAVQSSFTFPKEMDHTKRISESLKVLNAHAEQLMAALYNIKHMLNFDGNPYLDSVCSDSTSKTSNPREGPKLLNDVNLVNILKAFQKKFPECPEMNKVAGYQALTTDSKNIQDELRGYYSVFVDVLEFLDTAQNVLHACEKLSGLNSIQHFLVATPFFQLLTNFVFLHLMLAESANEKKAIVACYNFLYSSDNGTAEPSFQKLCKYFVEYEKPHLAITENFANMSPFISQLLLNFYAEHIRVGCIPIEVLRKDAAYVFTNNIKVNTTEDLKLRLLPCFNQFTTFVVIGTFCCPAEVLKQQPLADMVKFVLGQTLSIVMFRTEIFNVNAEFDALVKANSKLMKIRNLISYAPVSTIVRLMGYLGFGIVKAVALHSDRRSYLRFNLRQILNLGHDRPFILGYKLPIIEALMTLAREEIVWYFAHHDRTMVSKQPKLAPKSPQTQQPSDPAIAELICLLYELKDLIRAEKKVIQDHFVDILKNNYAAILETACGELFRTNAPNDAVTKSLQEIVESVKNVTIESNFEPLRMNYARLLVHFHSSDTSIAVSTVPDFVSIMNEVVTRSRYVDDLSQVVDSITDLKFLYYYRPLLQDSYEEALRSQPQQIRFFYVFPRMAADFVQNCGPYYPAEFTRIGTRSQQFAEDFFNQVGRSAAEFIQAVSAHQINFDHQVLPEASVKFAPDRREKGKPKIVEKPLETGYESRDNYTNLGNLADMKRSMLNAVRFFGHHETFRVFDTIFVAKEYLLEAIVAKVRSFLSANVFLDEMPTSPREGTDEAPFMIKRPSVFLAELTSYLSVLESIDDICPINISETVKDIILDEIDLSTARKQNAEVEAQNAAKKGKPKKIQVATGQSYLLSYSQWYCELLRDKGTAGVAVISPLKRCVVSHSAGSFQALLYTHPGELMALCEILGPSGIRFMDEKLVQQASAYVKDIKDIVTLNQEPLQAIEKNWHIEAKFEETARKLKQMDELIQKTINLGFILEFRTLLFEAMTSVMDTKAGGVFRTIKRANERYPANIYSVPEFLPLDNLANYVGLRNNIDISFRAAMQSHCRNPAADHKIYVLLPYIYAVAMRQVALDEKSIFNPRLDVFDNNAHCLPIAISMMLTYLISITAPNDMDNLIDIQKEFLQIASTFLLRIKTESDTVKATFTLLLKFVHMSQFLTDDMLEEHVPYTIVRNCYSDLFSKAGFKMASRTEEDVQAE